MTNPEHALSPAGFETFRSIIEEMRAKTATAPELDELYSDPETLRRIGVAIATAAQRASWAKY